MGLPFDPIKLAQAAAGFGVGAYKVFAGSKQIKDGKKLNRENVFQNYYRPSESLQALQLAKNAYNNQGVAGQQIIANNIDSGAATGLDDISRNTSSSGDLLDAATKLEVNKNQQMANLGLAGAQQQQQDVANLQNQLGTQAGYSDKEFQYNVTNPYERKAAAASALIEAGNKNKFAGLDNMAGTATSALDTMSNSNPARTSAIPSPTSIVAPTSVMPSQGYQPFSPQITTPLGTQGVMNGASYDPSGFNSSNMVFDPRTQRMTFRR